MTSCFYYMVLQRKACSVSPSLYEVLVNCYHFVDARLADWVSCGQMMMSFNPLMSHHHQYSLYKQETEMLQSSLAPAVLIWSFWFVLVCLSSSSFFIGGYTNRELSELPPPVGLEAEMQTAKSPVKCFNRLLNMLPFSHLKWTHLKKCHFFVLEYYWGKCCPGLKVGHSVICVYCDITDIYQSRNPNSHDTRFTAPPKVSFNQAFTLFF